MKKQNFVLLAVLLTGCGQSQPVQTNTVAVTVPSITVSNALTARNATFSCITNEHGIFVIGLGDLGGVAIYGVAQ